LAEGSKENPVQLAVLIKCWHGTAPPYFADEFIRSSDLWVYHHWSFVIYGCRPLVTELFRSPLSMSGINYHSTLHLNCPCKF